MVALLTQREVAARLRCSISKVKRLRDEGLLVYIPGRPLMIDEADLLAYIENAKRRETEKAEKAAAEKAFKNSPAGAAQLAKKIFALRRMRAKATPKPKPK